MDIGSQLLPGLTALEDNLTNMIRPILSMNPIATTPSFDLTALVILLKLCLPAQNMFRVGRQECAGEFLESLLLSLNLNPYISSFIEIGICPHCNMPQTSTFNTRSQFLLLLPLDQHSPNQVDLHTEVNRVLQGQFFSLTCQTLGCVGYLTRMTTHVRCTEQELSIYWIGRNLSGTGQKCLRQITEPAADTNLWRGKECLVAIAHTGRSSRAGHWFTFLKLGGVWWRSDTSLIGLLRQNPFHSQLLSSNQPSAADFTLDILFFK